MNAGDAQDVADTRALVMDELDRMSRLVDDMVLLAASEQPDFVRPREVELGALVDEVLDKARPLADRRWTLDARSEVVVSADPQRLTQALVQLVSNAVRHTAPGGTIGLGSRSDGRQVRIWVRDSGPGVPVEDRERIFDRFRRGRAARGEGSGLGLSIVRAIAEAHAGTVAVESEPGGGARFVLTLPQPDVSGTDPSSPTTLSTDTVELPVVRS
jgi:signal transduction histidine kinase